MVMVMVMVMVINNLEHGHSTHPLVICLEELIAVFEDHASPWQVFHSFSQSQFQQSSLEKEVRV